MSSLPFISHHLFVAAVRTGNGDDPNHAPEPSDQISQKEQNRSAESASEGYPHDEASEKSMDFC